ncbi:uncharacterized protein LOC111020195 [Momordica charantia]|uniref:Uncharacterized protein LOC111020195 n=1 Tax=Momordica charantia TaxID=3673 RepID=A0A6J1DG39_MOMCH|nr:uncharacterized protein LOC111020195 [Momordica charantia]
MEEYLQYMKTLRLQMNDVEDQASKISVEEHMLFTTIQTMENDLISAKSELKQLKEDAEQMMRAKGEICSQILAKQRKIASLESDISTLSQTLELIQQEKVSLGAKIIEKSIYYTKAAEEINLKFQDLQDWVNANMIRREVEEHELVKLDTAERASETEGSSDTIRGISGTQIYCNPKNLVEEKKDLLGKLESAKAKLSQVTKMKCAVILENSKIAQSIEEVKSRLNEFDVSVRGADDIYSILSESARFITISCVILLPGLKLQPELREMDVVTLDEEYKALLSDKAGETEYSQSLQDQIAKLKGISRVIKCTCGEEYKAGVDLCG